MLGTRTSLMAALALAATSMPGTTRSGRPGRAPRNLEGEYLGQEPKEIKEWNAAVDARKAAKRERQQLRAARS